jgi:hypothetical protein
LPSNPENNHYFPLIVLLRLELLSLAECPVSQLPAAEVLPHLPPDLHSLNISTTKIHDWAEVDKLRQFPALDDLRIAHCPFLDEYTAHEKRMMLIARLPNVQILNGGDRIGPVEREDAERAFIRHFLDTPEHGRPARFDELVAIHGLLDPLVNVDLTPEMVNIMSHITTSFVISRPPIPVGPREPLPWRGVS